MLPLTSSQPGGEVCGGVAVRGDGGLCLSTISSPPVTGHPGGDWPGLAWPGVISQMTPSHPCRRKHEPGQPPTSHISCRAPAGSAQANICVAPRWFLYSTQKIVNFLLEINQSRVFFANISDLKHGHLLPSSLF